MRVVLSSSLLEFFIKIVLECCIDLRHEQCRKYFNSILLQHKATFLEVKNFVLCLSTSVVTLVPLCPASKSKTVQFFYFFATLYREFCEVQFLSAAISSLTMNRRLLRNQWKIYGKFEEVWSFVVERIESSCRNESKARNFVKNPIANNISSISSISPRFAACCNSNDCVPCWQPCYKLPEIRLLGAKLPNMCPRENLGLHQSAATNDKSLPGILMTKNLCCASKNTKSRRGQKQR